jgi:hypothetical protein
MANVPSVWQVPACILVRFVKEHRTPGQVRTPHTSIEVTMMIQAWYDTSRKDYAPLRTTSKIEYTVMDSPGPTRTEALEHEHPLPVLVKERAGEQGTAFKYCSQ